MPMLMFSGIRKYLPTVPLCKHRPHLWTPGPHTLLITVSLFLIFILLDLSADFNAVSYTILSKQLSEFTGLSGTALLWFHSCLSKQQQYVTLNPMKSVTWESSWIHHYHQNSHQICFLPSQKHFQAQALTLKHSYIDSHSCRHLLPAGLLQCYPAWSTQQGLRHTAKCSDIYCQSPHRH